MNYLFPDEDKDEFLTKFNFGEDNVSNENINAAKNRNWVVCYKYLDKVDDNFSFNQFGLTSKEFQPYFEFMGHLCSENVGDLLGNSSFVKDWHFRKSEYKGKLRDVVNSTFGFDRNLDINKLPVFYHFALYTTQNANRAKDIRSPRVYFFLGNNACIYPIFMDLYHEINPIK